jgi:branched-chain amino acid transport system permease protein
MKKVMTLLRSKWWLIMSIALFAALPPVMGAFWVFVATEIAIMALFALSFSLLYSYLGQLSFGQGAYFGVGAYTVALMLTKTDINFFLCMLAGIFAGGVWALLTGYFVVRLAGIYFAIMTMVFAQVTFFIIFEWYSFTGGDNGIQGTAVAGILGQPVVYFYFTLAIVMMALTVFYLILNSPFGRSLRCIRDNTERATFVGIPVRKHMWIAFVIAGLFAGLAGALYPVFNRSVSADISDWVKSGDPAFMTILGGVYAFFGPMVGSFIFVLLDTIITSFTEYILLVMGLILALVIRFMPGGILGMLQEKVRGRKAKTSLSRREERTEKN